MDETDLISQLQTHLSDKLTVPIRTKGMEDERPVPLVKIRDWDTTEMNYHNSAFAGDATGDFDDDGNIEYERYLNFDWKTRVEILCRHYDEVEVSKLKENVKNELRLIRENPLQFDNELKQCRLSRGGNPTSQFVEPKEAELMVSARFYGDHTITITESDSEHDIIDSVQRSFTFNP